MVEAPSSTDYDVAELLKELESQTSAQTVGVSSTWLYQNEMRLDAQHYSTDASRALLAVEKFPGEVKNLSDIVDECFILGRFNESTLRLQRKAIPT